MKAEFDGANGYVFHFRDFGEDEDAAVFADEPGVCGIEGVERFAAAGVRFRKGFTFQIGRRFHTERRGLFLRIHAESARDGDEPDNEASFACVEMAQLSKSGNKGVLCEVFGAGVILQKLRTDAVNAGLVELDQNPKRLLLSGKDSGDRYGFFRVIG